MLLSARMGLGRFGGRREQRPVEPGGAGMTPMRMLQHFALAALVSYGLSVGFWAAFGVFKTAPFILVSLACALIGALAGRALGNWLIVTAAATSLVRLAVFFTAANPFAAV